MRRIARLVAVLALGLGLSFTAATPAHAASCHMSGSNSIVVAGGSTFTFPGVSCEDLGFEG